MQSSLKRPTFRLNVMAPLTLLLLLTAGIGGASIAGLSAMDDRETMIRTMWLPSVGIQGQLQSTFERFRTAQIQYAITSLDNRGQVQGELLRRLADVEQARSGYEPYIARDTDDEKFMQQYDQAWIEYKQLNQKLIDRQIDLPDLVGKDVLASLARVRSTLKKDLTFNLTMGLKAADESAEIYFDTKWAVGCLTVVMSMICILLGYQIGTKRSA